ncbi:hypothetical protein PYW07_011950 [Mythimna separata]|uniref:Uncharacterized protein n=1 Tax=Mythimna separata TaxID=271217 RepID=A0AAD8DRY3_MYTSE|nr:hypothetical protein PYW07_011950 [Mythimna separata]
MRVDSVEKDDHSIQITLSIHECGQQLSRACTHSVFHIALVTGSERRGTARQLGAAPAPEAEEWRARAGLPVCAHLAADMDALTQLVVLCVCGAALGEPLGEALRRHSRYGVYARDFAQYEREPYVYAAIPLHAPVPVLRVLSPAPLARERARAPSAHHPVYARPPYADDYAPSAHEYDASYEAAQYASYEAPQYAPHAGLYAAASAPDEGILYARPAPGGGYTYHSAPRPARRAPAAADAPPYIIRVHKYRVTKER